MRAGRILLGLLAVLVLLAAVDAVYESAARAQDLRRIAAPGQLVDISADSLAQARHRIEEAGLSNTDGSRFMYTYGFEGDAMYYWFGEKGSENYSVGTFSADGNTITGRWQWPNPDGTTGGYSYTLERQRQ